MFTGIVEELGIVKKIKKGANSAVFTIDIFLTGRLIEYLHLRLEGTLHSMKEVIQTIKKNVFLLYIMRQKMEFQKVIYH